MIAANLILALLAVAAVATVSGVGFRAGRPVLARRRVEEHRDEERERKAA